MQNLHAKAKGMQVDLGQQSRSFNHSQIRQHRIQETQIWVPLAGSIVPTVNHHHIHQGLRAHRLLFGGFASQQRLAFQVRVLNQGSAKGHKLPMIHWCTWNVKLDAWRVIWHLDLDHCCLIRFWEWWTIQFLGHALVTRIRYHMSFLAGHIGWWHLEKRSILKHHA